MPVAMLKNPFLRRINLIFSHLPYFTVVTIKLCFSLKTEEPGVCVGGCVRFVNYLACLSVKEM